MWPRVGAMLRAMILVSTSDWAMLPRSMRSKCAGPAGRGEVHHRQGGPDRYAGRRQGSEVVTSFPVPLHAHLKMVRVGVDEKLSGELLVDFPQGVEIVRIPRKATEFWTWISGFFRLRGRMRQKLFRVCGA